MKKIILISFFVLFNSLLYGQELSLKTCFEDSQGNKDSLILGYDVLGTDTIDTIFNEQNIFNIPWNNTFEVRAGEELHL